MKDLKELFIKFINKDPSFGKYFICIYEKNNKYLLSKSIIIRTLDNYNMPECIRVTIGTEKENKILIGAFKSFFKNDK